MVSELFVLTLQFPQVVTHDGSSFSAPVDMSGDDGWLHQDLVTGGQGLLWFPWSGKFPEVFWICRVEVEGGSAAVGPVDAV